MNIKQPKPFLSMPFGQMWFDIILTSSRHLELFGNNIIRPIYNTDPLYLPINRSINFFLSVAR